MLCVHDPSRIHAGRAAAISALISGTAELWLGSEEGFIVKRSGGGSSNKVIVMMTKKKKLLQIRAFQNS